MRAKCLLLALLAGLAFAIPSLSGCGSKDKEGGPGGQSGAEPAPDQQQLGKNLLSEASKAQ